MVSINEREEEFQKALKAWKYASANNMLDEAKKNWDIMYMRVYDACMNIGKTKCVGIHVDDLEGKCLDATNKIMNKIKRGEEPSKLSSYCYLWVIGRLYNEKEKFWDRTVDYDFSNSAYIMDEDGTVRACESDY